jgi:PAS domain S-box-containing protein
MAKALILIVEDETIIAMELEDRLKSLGYAIPAMVATGTAAIKKTVETHPDLVLMDIRLKGQMDGIETAAQIQTHYDVPVVYLTAYADEDTLQRAKTTEPFGYLIKPFAEQELHTTIEMALYKHQLYQKLRESEERYRIVAETATDAIVTIDEESRITFVNPATERIFGYTQDEMLGQLLTMLMPEHLRASHKAALKRYLDTNQKHMAWQAVKVTGLHKSGQEIPLEISFGEFKKDGQCTFTGIIRDITERVLLEKQNAHLYTETQRRAEELAALNEAGRAMTSTLKLDAVLARMITKTRTLLEAEDASVLLYEPSDDELIFAAVADPSSKTLVGTRMPISVGIAGWSVQEGLPLLVDDVQGNPHFYNQIDAMTGLTTRSLIAVPLIFKKEIIGVVEVINKIHGTFDQHDLELLEALSSAATIAIKNAQLYEAEREQKLNGPEQ